jgi:hypothetical protein
MSILLGQYDFGGPFVAQSDVLDKPGLIAVLIQTGKADEEEFELLELVETASCRQSAARAFADCSVTGALSLAVYYTGTDEHATRCKLRAEIIAEFDSECEFEEENSLDLSREQKMCVAAMQDAS